jgi:sodium-coupled neutral amino acid transporter 2
LVLDVLWHICTLPILIPAGLILCADSLRFTSALSVGLAIVFLIIAVGISIIKIISGGIGMPRLFPVITDAASVFDLFTVVPVLVTAYICHYNGMKMFETFVHA